MIKSKKYLNSFQVLYLNLKDYIITFFYSDTDNVEVHAQRCGRYTQLLTQLTKSNIYISEQLRE